MAFGKFVQASARALVLKSGLKPTLRRSAFVPLPNHAFAPSNLTESSERA
jgi:hypothetical protein